MAKDPAILFFIDKWFLSTKEMKADCRGWYLNLILHQFDKKDLPNDIEELANLADVRHSEYEVFEQVFEQVLKHKFKLNERGRLENEFAKEILMGREKFKDKRSNSGKLSYVLKYFRRNFKYKKGFEEFFKENCDLNFDIKNEQVLKQVFEQTLELYINVNEDVNINKLTWKESFEVYKKELYDAFEITKTDRDFITTHERLNPGVDIILSIEKSIVNFWATEAGWKHKNKRKNVKNDWPATFGNTIGMNKVYKQKADITEKTGLKTDEEIENSVKGWNP